ncbi:MULTISPECIES: hypothetical protein [Mycolicibacter]|uniref:Uncharacterized protein n=2 Tax=Mycolicibacter TaxID=1073531 RepID=A0ABU5XLW0_9MYCO|nr:MULTISPECIES: hypothetical protein [unclassified Mycolicibacter]MEB3022979.1 hypothetical protein [Mycolicibacter sp. MYC098]MEB3033489.1 hypothetical protein [Mycolicibacter sp. MYC340]
MGLYSRAQIVDGTGWPPGAQFWHVDREKVDRVAAALKVQTEAVQTEPLGNAVEENLTAVVRELLGALS